MLGREGGRCKGGKEGREGGSEGREGGSEGREGRGTCLCPQLCVPANDILYTYMRGATGRSLVGF